MSLGLGTLRLDPRAFWSMTLPEFAAAARAVVGRPPVSHDRPLRSDMKAMMFLFPDMSPLQKVDR